MIFITECLCLTFKIKTMKKGTIILMALGALAAYKYNKMTEEEKTAFMDKGKKIFDENISPLIKSTLGLADDPAKTPQSGSIK